MPVADASGSTGSSVTTWPLAGPTFDASIPPFAQTKPWRVSVISTPFAIRTTRTASRSTTSIWRASRSNVFANSIACGRGSTVVRSTIAPSALETIFCVTTRTSSSRSGVAPGVRSMASPRNAATSSPGTTSGMPSRATTSRRPSAGIRGLEHLGRLAGQRLDEQQVVGRVDVEAERSVELDIARPDRLGAGLVRCPAVAAERGIDRVGRSDDEAVRAAAVAIRRQDDERPLPDDARVAR